MVGEQDGQGGNGGAIVMDGQGRDLTICGATVTGNHANAFGGAPFRTGYQGEPTTIDRSTFADNEIPDHDDDDMPSGAGGLYIQGTAVTLTNSTISGNKARSSAGLWILGHGGQQATANLTNVTIADNATWPQPDFTTRGIGAGLVIGDNTIGPIINCTITGNYAQYASREERQRDLTDQERAELRAHAKAIRRARDRDRYRKLPRQKVLLTASLLLTGSVRDGVGVESFLVQTVERSGRRVSFTPRAGVELEPIHGRLQLRDGTYLEPTRFDAGRARLHATFGIDVRVLEWAVFGLWEEGTRWRLGAFIDLSERYASISGTLGVWH